MEKKRVFVLNGKAVELLQKACDMAKEGKKSYNGLDAVIKSEDDGFIILTKTRKVTAMKRPSIDKDFYIIEPYFISVYTRKTGKRVCTGTWENKVITAHKVQLIKKH